MPFDRDASKEMEPLTLLAEAGAVLVLSGSAYIMTLKDKLSLQILEKEQGLGDQEVDDTTEREKPGVSNLDQ